MAVGGLRRMGGPKIGRLWGDSPVVRGPAPAPGRLALQPLPADKRSAERSDADSDAPVVSAARFRRASGSGPAAEWARVVQAEWRLAVEQLMCALVNTADSDRVAHVRGLLDVPEEEMRDLLIVGVDKWDIYGACCRAQIRNRLRVLS